MKKTNILPCLLLLLIVPVFSFGQPGSKPVDNLNVPGPIVFDNRSYNLSWTSHPAMNFYKQEYIQKDDNVNRFSSMLMLDLVTGKANCKDMVTAKMEELKKIKAGNPVVNYEMLENKGEYMLDFILSENSADGRTVNIVERNVYRYKTFTDKAGHKGVLLFGVSTRAYGNDIDKFFADLKTNKADLLSKVGKFTIPEITINK